MKSIILLSVKSIKNLKSLKYHIFVIKLLSSICITSSSICNKCGSKDGKIFKKTESIKY